MKLPISIFPNVTEYTKANWTGYLEPRDITLTNHTDLGSDITWEMFDKGTIHIHKPRENSITNALMEWKTQCPDNTKVVVMFRDTQGRATDWPDLAVFKGIPMTRKMEDGNTAIYVSDTNGWTLTGLTFDIAVSWASDVYISLVNGDRLDACLSGNHLKSISVGDKLGLVYWDGTYFGTDGAYLTRVSGSDDWAYIYATDVWDDTGCLGLVREGAGVTKTLLAKPGTINLSDYGISLAKSTSLITGNHLMHVI